MSAQLFNSTTTAIVERLVTSSDGGQIFAQAIGDPRLPTLVFVHGLALSTLVWASILHSASLLKNYRLIAYDLRGHGRSVKPEDEERYSSKHYADDFVAVTKAFNVNSKPILVGWSLGAAAATDVTEHYGPDALAGIVYVAALPWLEVQQQVSHPWVLTVIPFLGTLDNSTAAISSRIAFTNGLFNHPERYPSEVLWSWLGSTFLPDIAKVTNLFSRAQNTTNLFLAGAKGVPLLLLDGEADRFINGDAVDSLVKGKFRDLERHTTKNGSHVFFYEDEKEFVANLAKFAKRVFSKRR